MKRSLFTEPQLVTNRSLAPRRCHALMSQFGARYLLLIALKPC